MALLWIALGGALGAVCRYALSLAAGRYWPDQNLPIGTLLANVIGCLLIGVLAGIAEGRLHFSAELRGFLFIGLLGGFTTFSSFGLETLFLIRNGGYGWAVLYVGAQVGAGLLAVAGGWALGRIGT